MDVGIDRAVVACEGHLAQRCHFSPSHFVEDLARFGFDLRIYFGRLGGCEELQNTFRDPGIDQSISNAVMIPSRPKIVLNQGTPAYG